MCCTLEITEGVLALQEIKESNKHSLRSMWADLRSKIKVIPEHNLLDVSAYSAPRRFFTSDGVSYKAKLILGGFIDGKSSSSIYLHVVNEQRDVIASGQYFISLPDEHTLEFDSDMKVEAGYDHSGLGSGLADLGEEVQLKIAKIFIEDMSQRITRLKSTVVDATTEQNPHWTTRRYKGLPGWVQINEKTWERTINVDPELL